MFIAGIKTSTNCQVSVIRVKKTIIIKIKYKEPKIQNKVTPIINKYNQTITKITEQSTQLRIKNARVDEEIKWVVADVDRIDEQIKIIAYFR